MRKRLAAALLAAVMIAPVLAVPRAVVADPPRAGRAPCRNERRPY